MINSKIETILSAKETKITHRHVNFTNASYSLMFLALALTTFFAFPNKWFDSGYDFGNLFKIILGSLYSATSLIYILLFIKNSSKKDLKLRMELILMYRWYLKPYSLWGSYKNMFAYVVLLPYGVLNCIWMADTLTSGLSGYCWQYFAIMLIDIAIFAFFYYVDKIYWNLFIRKLTITHGRKAINRMVKEREMESDFEKPRSFAESIANIRKTWKRDIIFWLSLFTALLFITPFFIKIMKRIYSKFDQRRSN